MALREVRCVKLIVGLGNLGPEYELSPHNMGFGVIDRLAERHNVRVSRKEAESLCGRLPVGGQEVWLVKPQTYMNRSGQAVEQWLFRQGCDPQDLVVIADDLDLPWGRLRIRQRGGAGGHHGLESILEAIGSREFPRVRIGVQPENEMEDPVRYLLSPVKRAQQPALGAVLDRAADAVEAILTEGTEKAMTMYNRRDSSAAISCGRSATNKI